MHVRELEKLVAENSINVNHLHEVTSSLKTENEKLKATISSLSGEITDIDTELTRIKKRDAIISSSIANYSTRIQSIGDDKIDKELSDANRQEG